MSIKTCEFIFTKTKSIHEIIILTTSDIELLENMLSNKIIDL